MMKKHKILMTGFLACVLAGCGGTPEIGRALRPVKVTQAAAPGLTDKSFSGVVMPDQYSDLAFRVSGPLIALNVVEGQRVKKGQVIAEIDPVDYRLQYEASKSSYLTAKSQLERAEKLLTRDAISRQDYESMRANFDNAKSAYENADNLLVDTKLRAPFDGFIQTKYVENYQKIQQGSPIVCLIDPNRLQIQFTMPESNVEYFLADPDIYVEFENYKSKLFKAKVKEFVQASTDGSGIPVYLHIDDRSFNLRDYSVAVGFTCRVILRQQGQKAQQGVVVPLSSVFTVTGSDSLYVYVLNSVDSTVHRRAVKQSGVSGRDKVTIASGLSEGEEVVVAGTMRLTDGQKVKVLTE